MFADKTTRAKSTVNRLRSIGRRVMVIKHRSDDARYGEGLITHDTHDTQVDARSVTALMDLLTDPEYNRTQVVVLDEAQFFPDLYEFCLHAAEIDQKHVHVFGLDGDFERKPFGQVAALCPVADTFEKVQAFCQMCDDEVPAAFTCAIADMPDSGVRVGGKDVYMPVCRRHYLLHH